jgi:hypothetical protein
VNAVRETFLGGSTSAPTPGLTGFIGGVAADELRYRAGVSWFWHMAHAAVAMAFTL